jgi:hypothetical protein
MRFPINDRDHFATDVNLAFRIIQDTYFLSIKPEIEMRKVNAMLGDGSVTQIDSFEPLRVIEFYQRLIGSLKGWVSTGISRSQTDDLHRIYCQFSQAVGQYRVHSYFGIQYRALPYYQVDKRVIEIQKELAQIDEEAGTTFMSMATRGNHIVQKELERIGYTQVGIEELLAKLFWNERLVADLEEKAAALENEFPKFRELSNKKNQLFSELNDLLIELCQISPVLIDYNKLMQGEEGVVTYFDMEEVRTQTREINSWFNTKRLTKELTGQVVGVFNEVANTMRDVGKNIAKRSKL